MHTDSAEQAAATAVKGAAPGNKVRLRGLLVMVPCWAVLIVAWTLKPYACGYGTHEQLDLPGCSFLARTGWPCPTCGLTTSVAAAARGRVAAAWMAHPFGPVLLAAVAVLAAAGTIDLLTGVDAIGRLRPRLWWVWAAVAGLLGGWGLKLAIGLAGGTLPLR